MLSIITGQKAYLWVTSGNVSLSSLMGQKSKVIASIFLRKKKSLSTTYIMGVLYLDSGHNIM